MIAASLVAMVHLSVAPYGALPSPRQIAWHEMDQYVLVHFTPTTFENKEWGYGDADPKIFNPTDFDADQIVKAVKAGEFKGLILVAKHHDGFCLWPTKTTPYNITKSPWKNGKGDMVKEFEKATRKAGLKFGVYCSPWDRNHPEYGRPAYAEVYREQLRELYTNYGELFMSWHDGANGGDGYYGGAREMRKIDRATYYGWEKNWALTRLLQPNANLFSDVGPDVRWVGNETGQAAETSWATFTPEPLKGKGRIGPGEMDYTKSPVGTRNGRYWLPAECDVPHRPGWFYHPEEDSKVKTAEQLFSLYLESVGRGGSFNLGIAPDKRGQLHEIDVKELTEYGRLLRTRFKDNLALKAAFQVDGKALSSRNNLRDRSRYSEVHGSEFVLTWKEPIDASYVRIRENIKLGQRIDKWSIEGLRDGSWVTLSKGESIGANRTVKVEGKGITQVRVKISGPVVVNLSEVSVF